MKHMFKSNHIIITRINCAAILIPMALFTALSMSPASAADNGISTNDLIELSLCRASADPDNIKGDINQDDAGKNTCCSKKEGFCIFCEPDGSCKKTEYSKRPDRFKKPTLTTPSDGVIAPVTPKRPIAKGTQQTIPRKLKLN